MGANEGFAPTGSLLVGAIAPTAPTVPAPLIKIGWNKCDLFRRITVFEVVLRTEIGL